LLLAVVNSLPKNVQSVNITMGMPLKALPAAHFFIDFLKLCAVKSNTLYYKDVLKLLNHPLGKKLFSKSRIIILEEILKRNLTNISFDSLIQMADEQEKEITEILFFNQYEKTDKILLKAKKILFLLKEKSEIKADLILLQSLYKIY